MATKKKAEDRIAPLRFTDNETGDKYELDFSRESLRFMASEGFKVDEEIVDYIADRGPDFFYYACRKNHKLNRNQANALLEKLGGLSPKILERLIALYGQALTSNSIVQTDEELEKNARVTVEF